jgi:hypothetical protein
VNFGSGFGVSAARWFGWAWWGFGWSEGRTQVAVADRLISSAVTARPLTRGTGQIRVCPAVVQNESWYNINIQYIYTCISK